MLRTQNFDLFRRFKDGLISAESDERFGRPLSIRNNEAITKVHELVTADRILASRK